MVRIKYKKEELQKIVVKGLVSDTPRSFDDTFAAHWEKHTISITKYRTILDDKYTLEGDVEICLGKTCKVSYLSEIGNHMELLILVTSIEMTSA